MPAGSHSKNRWSRVSTHQRITQLFLVIHSDIETSSTCIFSKFSLPGWELPRFVSHNQEIIEIDSDHVIDTNQWSNQCKFYVLFLQLEEARPRKRGLLKQSITNRQTYFSSLRFIYLFGLKIYSYITSDVLASFLISSIAPFVNKLF